MASAGVRSYKTASTPPTPSPPPQSYSKTYDVPSTLDSDPSDPVGTTRASLRPVAAPGGARDTDSLAAALTAMRDATPPERFMGKYLLMPDGASGGQATVQFARGGNGGFLQYAIKCAVCLCYARFHLSACAVPLPIRRVQAPPVFR